MNFKTSSLGPLCFLFFIFLCIACKANPNDTRTNSSDRPYTTLETTIITIHSAQGPVSIEVELARTDEERSTGLMFRTELEDGKGMLFIFEIDQILSFWMKDTQIPLSIAYIAYDGTIIDIRNMQPYDLTPVHSSRSVRYALEVPQNWFSRVGIQEGDIVSLVN